MNQKDLKYGKIGEIEAWNYFKRCTDVKYIFDVRDCDAFQTDDVDFVIYYGKGKLNKVEVKTDSKGHQTRNIAYETFTRGRTGCLARSTADWIMYYFEKSGEMYKIAMKPLRGYIKNSELKEIPMGEEDGRGYLLRIDELIDLGIAKKI